MNTIKQHLRECADILEHLDENAIGWTVNYLARLRESGGRLFLLGVGGSAATASHAANDFRKLCGFEAYAATDNVAELTARANDEGLDSIFTGWLRGSRLAARDAVMVISVGGGDPGSGISQCLVRAVELAQQVGACVLGVVGRQGGFTAIAAHTCIIIPPLYPERVTPHTEGIASVVLHLLVSHPRLQRAQAKWEASGGTATEREPQHGK